MKTPREKYQNDPQYRQFVDVLHSLIRTASYTPSELREMALLACIMYEEQQIQRHYLVQPNEIVEQSMKVLEKWVDTEVGKDVERTVSNQDRG